METISQIDVESILRSWQTGTLTERQVHDWAEDRYAVDAYEPESDACNAVLAQLDCMNINLLTSEDIPVLLDALSSTDYESVLSGFGTAATIEQRRSSLRAHPFYAKFCG